VNKVEYINSPSYPEQTLNGHVVDCYCSVLVGLRSLSAVEFIYRY